MLANVCRYLSGTCPGPARDIAHFKPIGLVSKRKPNALFFSMSHRYPAGTDAKSAPMASIYGRSPGTLPLQVYNIYIEGCGGVRDGKPVINIVKQIFPKGCVPQRERPRSSKDAFHPRQKKPYKACQPVTCTRLTQTSAGVG